MWFSDETGRTMIDTDFDCPLDLHQSLRIEYTMSVSRQYFAEMKGGVRMHSRAWIGVLLVALVFLVVETAVAGCNRQSCGVSEEGCDRDRHGHPWNLTCPAPSVWASAA